MLSEMDQDSKSARNEVSDICSVNDSTAPNSLLEEVACNVLEGSKSNEYVNAISISSVALQDSSNIQLGDRVICNGPITINRDTVNKPVLPVSATSKIKKILFGCDLKFKILTFVLIFLVICAIVVGVMFTHKLHSGITNSPKIKIISKEEWGAQPPDPVNQGTPLDMPLNKTIINHTVMGNCYTKECCCKVMREMQDNHLKLKYGDIGYSFVVCNDGNVYEGNGWDLEGAHTRGQNRISVGIAFNGNFDTEVPSPEMIDAAFLLMEEGVRLGMLTKDFKIYGARQFKPVNSPGDAFYQVIRTWPRWSEQT